MAQSTETALPPGYWQDARGNLVPDSKVKEEDKLQDDLVRRLIGGAEALNASLGAFRDSALEEAYAFRDLLGQEYGVKKGGEKGNMTLRTFDGALEVKVQISDTLSFGPELQIAKSLIDACIERWAEDANDNVRVLINDAFQVNKEGRIDTGRVLYLRRLKIDDADWHRAMEAIGNAIRVTHSKTYVRFYRRDPETGATSPITLDLASV